MNYQKLSELRYLREMSIVFAARENQLSIYKVLKFNSDHVPSFTSDQAHEIFKEYLCAKNRLLPKSEFLFPTTNNKPYQTEKFRINLKRLLKNAQAPVLPSNPRKLSPTQIEKLLGLKFSLQRPIFQVSLAVGMLGYLALRPNEVAKLKKEDVILSEETIILRDTKSREDQAIIIYPDLMEPLRNYLKHIGPNEPLFVRESNVQWERKDVYRAIKNFGTYYGFSQINPRKFRSTVANYMINAGMPIKYVSKYLRHKDIATTLRHYLEAAGINETRIASQSFHAILSKQKGSLNNFTPEE